MTNSSANRTTGEYLLLGITGAVITGLTPIFVRGSELGPIATASWRLGLALIVLLPLSFVRWLGGREDRIIEFTFRTMILGGLFALDLMFWQSSLILTKISVAAFLANVSPLFVVIFRLIIFRQRPRFFEIIAVCLGGTGAYLLAAPVLTLDARNVVGALAALCASGTFALFLITSERSSPTRGISRYTGLTLIALPIVLISMTGLESNFVPASMAGFAWVIGLAIVIHCLAFLLFFLSTAKVGAVGSSLVNLLQPVSATLLSIVFFQERISRMALIGMFAISVSVLLVALLRSNEQQSQLERA